jgi:hypothetical protein
MIPTTVAVLQIIIPVILIARLFEARRRSLLASLLYLLGLIAYVAAIAIAGVWLVLPWYTALVYLSVVAIGMRYRASDLRTLRWRPAGRLAYVELGICVLFVAGASGLFVQAVAARRAPAAQASVNLSFPLNGGTYYVVNGGGGALANAHVETLAEHARLYRGQSYAVDIARVDERGLRASALAPSSLEEYASVGEPVLAPCDGRVLQLENTAPDMIPPTPDSQRLAGNFVFIDCGAAQVLLAHLQRGSVTVRAGQSVSAGLRLGAIGNSGNSDEPHLHLHAQRAAKAGATSMLEGDPIPVTFYGRALARNDVVRTAAVPAPAMTETGLLYGQLGSTVVALLMLVVSVRWRRAGLAMFALLFAWASLANARTAWTSPMDYLGYAPFALIDVYRQFIFGFFAQHVTAIVLTIAACQAFIAVALLRGGRWRQAGLAGAIAFLLAIAPLGVGSGLPATPIMALGAAVLWRERRKPGAVIEMPSRRPATLRRAA